MITKAFIVPGQPHVLRAGEKLRLGLVWDYQPVWGTGSAIVELTPNAGKEIEWEKGAQRGG